MVSYIPATGTPTHLKAVGYDGMTWDKPWNLARGQLTAGERMPSALLNPGIARVLPDGDRLDLASLDVRDPLTGRGTSVEHLLRDRLHSDGLIVMSEGRVLAERYGNGMTERDLHLVHSCSKTLSTMMIGIAVDGGRLHPQDCMSDLLVELAEIQAWEGVTLQHVLDMATGLDTEEHYEDPDSMYWRYADAVGYYEDAPAESRTGALAFVAKELVRRVDVPGSRFNYASYLTNLLPVVVERAYGTPAVDLYERLIYQHIGAEQVASINLDDTGSPIVEGQISLTLRDFARWSHLMISEGRAISGEQVVPSAWVDECFRTDPARSEAFARSDYAELMPGAEYHNQCWVPEPDADTCVMLGIHGQFAYADRRHGLLIAGLSSFPDQANPLLIAVLRELWSAVSAAVNP